MTTKSYRIIAVVGNREGWLFEDIERYLGEYLSNYKHVDKYKNLNHVYFQHGDQLGETKHGEFIIISGGAPGVDFYAERYCYKNHIPFQKILPIEHLYCNDRFFVRNDFIAKLCDEMVVFDKKPVHSGSAYTANIARSLLKNVTVIKNA